MIGTPNTIVIRSVPKFGDVSQDTVILQRTLKDRGFDPGTPDGIFMNKTKAAVAAAQKAFGSAGTGVIGPMTLDFLDLIVVPVSPVTGETTVTQDFVGKKDRKIHPAMRLMIEAHLFPRGRVGEAWLKGDLQACFIEVCRAMAKIKIVEKGGNNKGYEVGLVQSIIGADTTKGDGAAWCLSLAQHPIAMIEDFFGFESPVLDSEHCVTTFNAAKKVPGLVVSECEPGTLALGRKGTTSSGHAMCVVQKLANGKMLTYEGNTSVTDIRDGDGSGLKNRDQKANGSLATLGFVRVSPYNRLPENAKRKPSISSASISASDSFKEKA